MSTTPQIHPSMMGQQQSGPQQFGQQQSGQQSPSTAPPQMPGQQFGQQFGQQQSGQQQPFQQHPLQHQLQQLGQQQPFQQLLQQLGQHQQQGQQQGQQGQQQISQPSQQAVSFDASAQVLGFAQYYWDVVTPFPNQSEILFLWVDNAWRFLWNPNQITHDEVQEAFAFGQPVRAHYDPATSVIQSVIVSNLP
jgi:hypothetical protein